MENPTSHTPSSPPEKDISSLGHLRQEDSVQAPMIATTNKLPEPSSVRTPPPSSLATPTLPMVHRLVLKHRQSGISQDTLAITQEEDDDDSDCFELEPGENWLRLVPKQAGRHSILDDTQDASEVGLIYPSILSLASLGEDVTISDECYLCLDVDGGTLAVKDMRPLEPSGSRRKRSTKPLQLSHLLPLVPGNQKPSLGISRIQQPTTPSALSSTTGTGESIRRSPWERLPRRQLRILRHGDRLCTSFHTAQSCGEGGLVLEYQYQLKSAKTERVSLGLLTQPMEEDSDVEATPRTVDGSDSPASGVKQSTKEPLVAQTWESKNNTQDEVSVADSDQTEEMGLAAMPGTTVQKLSLCTQPQEEQDGDVENPPTQAEPKKPPVDVEMDVQVEEPNKDPEEKENTKGSRTESGSQTLVGPLNEEKHPEPKDGLVEAANKKPETVVLEPLKPSMLLAPPKTPVQVVTLLPPCDDVDVDMPESALTMTQALMGSPAVLVTKTTTTLADELKPEVETRIVPPGSMVDAKVTADDPKVGEVAPKDTKENMGKVGGEPNLQPASRGIDKGQSDNLDAVQTDKKADNVPKKMPSSTNEASEVPCEHVGVPIAEDDFPQSAITMSPALLLRSVDDPRQMYSQEVSSTMLRETGEETPRDGNDDSSELTEVDEPSSRNRQPESSGNPASKIAPVPDHNDEDSEITDIEDNPKKVVTSATDKESTPATQEDDQEEIPTEKSKEIGEDVEIKEVANEETQPQRLKGDTKQEDMESEHVNEEVQSQSDSSPNAVQDPDVKDDEGDAAAREVAGDMEAEEVGNEDTQPLHLKEDPEQVDLESEHDIKELQSQEENSPDAVLKTDGMDDEDGAPPGSHKLSDIQETRDESQKAATAITAPKNEADSLSMVDDSPRHRMPTRNLRKRSPAAKEQEEEASYGHTNDKQASSPSMETAESEKEKSVIQKQSPVSLRKRRRDHKSSSADDNPTPPATRRSKRSRKDEPEDEAATPIPRTRRRRTSGSVLEELPTPKSDTMEASPYQHGTESDPDLRVMATGIAFDAKKKNLVKRIGGTFIENLKDAASANYLIAASDDVPLKRTPKLMVALCRTRNIVHLNWLEDSAKSREPLDPSPYLLLNEGEAEVQYNFLMHVSLERADKLRQSGHSLFDGLSFFLCKGVAGCKDAWNRTPPEGDFVCILEAAGGKLVKSLPTKNQSCRGVVVVVSKIESEAKKQRANARVAAAIKKGASSKSTEDIFHAIMDQKFCL